MFEFALLATSGPARVGSLQLPHGTVHTPCFMPVGTQGTVKAIWESLDKPYRAALEQNLIYTRLGNPIGQAELVAQHTDAATNGTTSNGPWIR